MKVKTSELTGAALDWAVAKCEGINQNVPDNPADRPVSYSYRPSTDWSQGGPIIERGEIAIQGVYADGELVEWVADSKLLNEDDDMEQYGPTPLIAAMKVYVAGKLGSVVKVPKELTC